MRTKWCSECRQVKRVELFDIDRQRGDGRSSRCKACRRQRQNRAGYSTCRHRALVELVARYPQEYQHHREQARLELAPDTAPAEVWDQARGRALQELSRRHRAEWRQHYRQLRAAYPTWPAGRVFSLTTARQRRAHRQEFLELLTGYAGARPAGGKLVAKISACAQRRLQLAHPQEYQALYAAERVKIGSPVAQPAASRAGQRGAAGAVPAVIGQPGGPR
jgi:hypothetical protein